MIIDKVEPYWKDADRARLARIEEEEKRILAKWEKHPIEGQHYILSDEWNEIKAQENEIYAEVEARYTKATRTAKAMLADVSEIVEAIEKRDFLDYVARCRCRNIEIGGKIKKIYDKQAEETFENCYYFILWQIRVQLNFFANDEKNTSKCIDIVEKRVSLWYVKEKPLYLPMLTTGAIDALGVMATKKPKREGDMQIWNELDVEAIIDNAQSKLNASALLLFLYSLIVLTKTSYHNKETDRTISFSLKKYAEFRGYDVTACVSSSAEEMKKEKKRAKMALDNARKEAWADLAAIQSLKTSNTEKIKGNEKYLYRLSYVTATEIENANVKISFTPEFLEVIHGKRAIFQIPMNIFFMDCRKSIEIAIALKLSKHNSIDNNVRKGTNNRIQIKNLLPSSGIITYDELQKTANKGHWRRLIKERLEEALEYLFRCGVLIKCDKGQPWDYAHEKGVILTPEEKTNLAASRKITYYDWEKLYLIFNMPEVPGTQERLARIEEKIEKAKSNKKPKRHSTKTPGKGASNEERKL